MGAEVLGQRKQTSHTVLLPTVFCFATFPLGLLMLFSSKSFSLCVERKLSAPPTFKLGYEPREGPTEQSSTPHQGPTPSTADDVEKRNVVFYTVIVFILLTGLLVQQ